MIKATTRTMVLTAMVVGIFQPATQAQVKLPDEMTRFSAPRELVELTPEQKAIEQYNQGVALRDRAAKLAQKAENLEGAKREKTLKKADKSLQNSITAFKMATEFDPELTPAWGNLGLMYARTGQFADAVRAFDGALAIEPNFVEAIQYRAEALLSLDRVDEAKQSYQTLLTTNRQQAARLLDSMKSWAQRNENSSASGDLKNWLDQLASAS
jgi:tetratricopeptide (TPR) repeat protein